ncbi:MAG: four helix bundle protein [Xenococcus sp. MO_188.B8]|nr:four helix bundle protein [Xenococcus sp. MO_188.B8]
MSDINDFKELRIWQKGIVITENCYFLTRTFPKDELYEMVQQIRRSAVSIPANIAEGYGRHYTKEYLRFLNISVDSINELETHLILFERVGLCPRKEVEIIIYLLLEESRIITSLIKKLEK